MSVRVRFSDRLPWFPITGPFVALHVSYCPLPVVLSTTDFHRSDK